MAGTGVSVLGGFLGCRQGFMLSCKELWPGIQRVCAILHHIPLFTEIFLFWGEELSKRQSRLQLSISSVCARVRGDTLVYAAACPQRYVQRG